MSYQAKAIANYFIQKADEDGKPIDPMKLQKLIFYAHGWHLAIAEKPLINEQVQAWKFGPVIQSVYHEFKKFGSNPIKEQALSYDGSKPSVPDSDKEVILLLDKIWEVYGKLSGVQLSNMTHEDGGPWQKARAGNEDLYEIAIPNETIKEYFVAKASASK